MAVDAAMLASISQAQIEFNPAFQQVLLHSASLWRDGQRVDRLKQARIELMRRERQLELQVIDGTQTLLLVLPDVRVGEAVEIAYSVIGDNPIFEGRMGAWMQTGWPSPVTVAHQRVSWPLSRPLTQTALGTSLEPERLIEGDRQVLRLVQRDVPGLAAETQTPPWHRSFPWLQYTEYRSWDEVEAWAQRLFARPLTNPGLTELLARLRATGFQGEALAAETLRLVQDEVRYFSASLGENSHRPKPPEQTWVERVGDCKDKTQLLVALLLELGFDAKPALVSVRRTKGLAQYAPNHELFDHVVTLLDLDGRRYYLDATMTGQGGTLASRGQYPYGLALVVGGGSGLQPVPEAGATNTSLEFEQRWDYSQPAEGAKLTTMMRAHGLLAERWRTGRAMGGDERLSQALGGALMRVMPGLRLVGEATVRDDRVQNVFEFMMRFEHPEPGRYDNGIVEHEHLAFELFDLLGTPAEAQRRTPWLLDLPRRVESRIVYISPQPLLTRAIPPPPPAEVIDKHLRMSLLSEASGNTLSYVRRIERRSDEVQPTDLASFRDNIGRMRQILGGRSRLPLLSIQGMGPEMLAVDRRVRGSSGWRGDMLGTIQLRSEMARLIDSRVIDSVGGKGRLAARALTSRAQLHNMLGDFARGLADAERALALATAADTASASTADAAAEVRAVALLGLGRTDESLAEFKRLVAARDGLRRMSVLKWLGSVQLHLGQAAEAEASLREVVDNGGSDDRDFALLWLYLAAERQGAGRGKAAIASHVERADISKHSGVLLRFLDGRLDRDSLLKLSRAKAEMERLNLAESYFFIGQQLAAQGQQEEAQRWYERTVETRAVPYREVTFAQLELARAGGRK